MLGRFSEKDREVVDAAIKEAADAVEMILEQGIEAAMNHYNGAGKKEKDTGVSKCKYSCSPWKNSANTGN